MPRPAILEGLKGVVKCNLSMAQITDSDVRRTRLGHANGNFASQKGRVQLSDSFRLNFLSYLCIWSYAEIAGHLMGSTVIRH